MAGVTANSEADDCTANTESERARGKSRGLGLIIKGAVSERHEIERLCRGCLCVCV